MERALVRRALAEEAGGDLIGCRRSFIARPRPVTTVLPPADDRDRGQHPDGRVAEVHRAALAAAAAGRLAVELRHRRPRAHPLRERVAVRAVGRGDPVVAAGARRRRRRRPPPVPGTGGASRGSRRRGRAGRRAPRSGGSAASPVEARRRPRLARRVEHGLRHRSGARCASRPGSAARWRPRLSRGSRSRQSSAAEGSQDGVELGPGTGAARTARLPDARPPPSRLAVSPRRPQTGIVRLSMSLG